MQKNISRTLVFAFALTSLGGMAIVPNLSYGVEDPGVRDPNYGDGYRKGYDQGYNQGLAAEQAKLEENAQSGCCGPSALLLHVPSSWRTSCAWRHAPALRDEGSNHSLPPGS